jgi:hypothetical protein
MKLTGCLGQYFKSVVSASTDGLDSQRFLSHYIQCENGASSLLMSTGMVFPRDKDSQNMHMTITFQQLLSLEEFGFSPPYT